MTLDEIGTKRKQFLYRSWHRGTREMDLFLGSFATRYLGGFDGAELEQYRQVLETPDPDLYDWITGRCDPPANRVTPVLERLLSHRFADKDTV